MKRRNMVLVVIVSLVLSDFAFADTLVSKNGQTVEGNIIQETESSYVMDIPGVGQLTLQKSEVRSLKRASAAKPLAKVSTAPKKTGILIEDRTWKIVYEKSGDQMRVTQLVPEGQTLETSRELVTVEFFTGVPTDLKSLQKGIEQTKATLQKSCPSLQFRQANQNEREILYQWQVSGCKNVDDQSELVRVRAMRGGLEVIHYAAKKALLSESERNQWVLWLSKTELSEALVDKLANKV